MSTASDLPIEGMPLNEKLLLMERLWADLSRNPSSIPTPMWHGVILAEREAALREGRTSFLAWESVKKRLRDETE